MDHNLNNLYKEFRDIDFDIKDGLSTAISNIGKNSYPYIKLNHDESISIFDNLDLLNEKLAKLEDKTFTELLKIKAQEKDINIIQNKDNQVFKKIEHKETNLMEYKINLTPKDFGSILKSVSHATFYQGDLSILNLYEHNIPSSQETIKCFPIYKADENLYIPQVAGCQGVEMPSIQILKLLQEYFGKEEIGELNPNFHWLPKSLEKLGIDRGTIKITINEILKKEDLFIGKDFKGKEMQCDGIKKPSEDSKCKITDINEEKEYFYLKYGNIGENELKNCQSFEIDTLTFIKEIKKLLIERKQSHEKWFEERESTNAKEALDKVNKGIDYFTKLIEKMENQKIEPPQTNLQGISSSERSQQR